MAPNVLGPSLPQQGKAMREGCVAKAQASLLADGAAAGTKSTGARHGPTAKPGWGVGWNQQFLIRIGLGQNP